MSTKIIKYYDAQELFDDQTIRIKQQVQQELDQQDPRQQTINLIQGIFPNADADTIINAVELQISTFKAITVQYKSDLESGNPQHKDIFMVAMGQIAFELQPYEYIVYQMYPKMAPLFHTILMWYTQYLAGRCGDVEA